MSKIHLGTVIDADHPLLRILGGARPVRRLLKKTADRALGWLASNAEDHPVVVAVGGPAAFLDVLHDLGGPVLAGLATGNPATTTEVRSLIGLVIAQAKEDQKAAADLEVDEVSTALVLRLRSSITALRKLETAVDPHHPDLDIVSSPDRHLPETGRP